jgi:Brp/Blh family beta-carotene 15,15'-monooxygenase
MVEQSPLLILFCSVLILLAGLPHGAYDWVIMRAYYQDGRLAAAILGYLALAFSVLGLWWIAPQVLLIVFLTYSVFHFGDSDFSNASRIHQISWGMAIVGLPSLLAVADVQALFSLLTQGSTAPMLTDLLAVLGSMAAVIHVVAARRRLLSIALLAVYGAVCWAAGALLAFACYFALLHSPVHLARWRNTFNQQGSKIILALSFAVIAVIAGAVWISSSGIALTVETINQATFRYTFIALAALTVPHMVLLSIANGRVH